MPRQPLAGPLGGACRWRVSVRLIATKPATDAVAELEDPPLVFAAGAMILWALVTGKINNEHARRLFEQLVQ